MTGLYAIRILWLFIFAVQQSTGVRARAFDTATSTESTSSAVDSPPNNLTLARFRQTNLSESGPVCFEEGPKRPPVNIDDCRSVLRMIVSQPDKRRVQEFQYRKKPYYPNWGTPPFGFFVPPHKCVLEILPLSHFVIDRFSWFDVKLLAQEIIEHCQEKGDGVGGRADVGNKIGWWVVIHGEVPWQSPGDDGVWPLGPSDFHNSTSLFEPTS